jgi:hypothetical protein
MIIHFLHDDTLTLGFDTGVSSEAFARMRLASLVSERGVIVSLNAREKPIITDWAPDGVTQAQDAPDTMILFGPDFEGESLETKLTSAAADGEQIVLIKKWATAVQALLESKVSADRFTLYPSACIVSPQGNAFFFAPQNIVLTASQSLPEAERLLLLNRWAHPDLNGRAALAYTGALLLYTVLSGQNPFLTRENSKDIDTLHTDIRQKVFLPLEYAAPGVQSGIAKSVNTFLSGQNASGFSAFIASLPDSMTACFTLLTGAEKERRAAAKEKMLAKEAQTRRRRTFWQKKRGMVIGIALAVLLVGIVAATIIKSRLDRPSTQGMDPEQVAQTYYKAMTDLDIEWMDACLARSADQGDVETITYLFVTSKVREAYENKDFFITPEEYQKDITAGEKIDPEYMVIGVSDLHLSQPEIQSDNSVTIKADYLWWYPASYADDTETSNEVNVPPDNTPLQQRREDVLTLSEVKGRWEIAKIARTGASQP